MATAAALALLLIAGVPQRARAQTMFEGGLSVCEGDGLYTEQEEEAIWLAFLDDVFFFTAKQCSKTCKALLTVCQKGMKAQDSCISSFIKNTTKLAVELCIGYGSDSKICKNGIKILEADDVASAKAYAVLGQELCEIDDQTCRSMCI